MSNETTAQKILSEIKYATIATASKNGEPWNTPVFCAHDGYDIFWSSHPDSLHSKNIANNNKVFICIYNPKAAEGEGVGLYMKATAQVLHDKGEIAHALELLGQRRGAPFKHVEKFIGDGPQRIYKAVPLQVWINDAHQDADGDFIKDFRIELNVDTKQ